MDDARTLLFPLYSSLATPVWLRALGAKIGRDVEASTVLLLPRMTSVGAGAFLGLAFLIQDAFKVQDSVAQTTFRTTTADVGVSLFRDYVLPFEAVSFLLLAALIGAVVLARKDEVPK